MKKLLKKRAYHSISIKESLRYLETSLKGLSDFEAQGRLNTLGKNELPGKEKFSLLKLFISQFNNYLVIIILIAAGLSFFADHLADAIFIVFVVLINTTVGFLQEVKAEKSLEKLKQSVEFYAKVIRRGNKKEISSRELAVGDIVELREGDKVPADGRMIEVKNLKINEAVLTGEWEAVAKSIQSVDKETQISDRSNCVFAGTIVEEGRGLMAVTATGINMELGKISELVEKQVRVKTPLQKKFWRFSRLIGIAILMVIIFFSAVYIWRGEDVQTVFITAIALTVSAIPEGLLPAITVVLVLGMSRLLRKKALVRRLNATESMGAVSVICMDKTGTLTQGNMQVSHILTGSRELLHKNGELENFYHGNRLASHVRALEIAVLVQSAYIENPDDEFSHWVIRGRRTDRALLLAGVNAGIDKREIEKEQGVVEEYDFNSANKYSASIRRTPEGKIIVYFLGAPEEVMRRSNFIDIDGKQKPVSSEEGRKLLLRVDELASQGLRILASGWREYSEKEYEKARKDETHLERFVLAGLIALKDPLRSDAAASVEVAKRAGIRPVIITGDHKMTARSIVNELGLGVGEDEILEGKDLDKMSDTELDQIVGRITIFARVVPEHKIRIVKALQKRQEVVAMAGDGVNDAPALKAADVGIAVGSGTDIAKEASDMVLLNDSFSVIVKAIEQGRLIRENIRRVIIYLMADDFSELFLFFSVIAIGLPIPLYPIQILWINLVEDGFPDIALTAEKDTSGLMERPPERLKDPLLGSNYKKFMLAVFLVSGLAALTAFYFSWKAWGDLEKARTIIFALIAFDSLIFAYIVRSFKKSVFSKNIFSNKILNGAVVVSFLILLSGIYFPPFQNILRTVPLDSQGWIIIFGISLAELLILELFKRRFLRK